MSTKATNFCLRHYRKFALGPDYIQWSLDYGMYRKTTFKDHDNRVFARKRSYIDKWKPSISEIHVKTKNTNIFVSWFTFLPMGDVDTHAPTRLSFQHAFNRDTCNFSGGLMQLLSSTFLFFWKDLMTPSVEISKYCLHSCKIMS